MLIESWAHQSILSVIGLVVIYPSDNTVLQPSLQDNITDLTMDP